MGFNIFDIVKISEKSPVKDGKNSFSNPDDDGVIFYKQDSKRDDLTLYFVSFENGAVNCYFADDLELVANAGSGKKLEGLSDDFRINPDVFYEAENFSSTGYSEKELIKILLQYENYIRNIEGISDEDDEDATVDQTVKSQIDASFTELLTKPSQKKSK